MKFSLKNSKYFSSEWWTNRYSFIIRNDNNLEERRRYSYTPLIAAFFIFTFFILFFSLGVFVASRFYGKTVVGGQDRKIIRKVVELQFRVDSLEKAIETKSNYVANIQKILGGDVTYMKVENPNEKTEKDNKKKKKQTTIAHNDTIDIDHLEKADIKLREEMEGRIGTYAGFSGNSRDEKLKDLYLFSPIKGIVSEKYKTSTEHYGIDIVAAKDAPIKSIANGTVIMSSWTDETGYVITVQHKSDLISSYKHCSSLLKKAGDIVKTGEIIAIIGNTGKFTSGPHLHFELWYKGSSIDPTEYLSLN